MQKNSINPSSARRHQAVRRGNSSSHFCRHLTEKAITPSEADRKFQTRRSFLRELISTENIIKLIVSSLLARYVMRLHEAANPDGTIPIVALAHLRAMAESDVAIAVQKAYEASEAGVVKSVTLGHETILKSIERQVTSKLFEQIKSRFVFDETSQVSRELVSLDKNGVSLQDKIAVAYSQAVLSMHRIISKAVVNQEQISPVVKQLAAVTTGKGLDALDVATGAIAVKGIYRSLFDNLSAIARTEMSGAFSNSVAGFGADKEWIMGYEFNLSSSHTEIDICDDSDGLILTKEDEADFPPLHLNCRCFLLPVIDPVIMATSLGISQS